MCHHLLRLTKQKHVDISSPFFRPDRSSRTFHATLGIRPLQNSFKRLCVRHIRSHSHITLPRPHNEKRRKPRTSLRKRELGEDHPETLELKNDLALLYKEQGDYDKAEPLFLEALKGRRPKLGDTHPHTLDSWNNLIDLYEAWNKPEKAEEWREKLTQIEDFEE